MDKLRIKQDLTDIVDAACMPAASEHEPQVEIATIILRFPQSLCTISAYRDNSGKWIIANE